MAEKHPVDPSAQPTNTGGQVVSFDSRTLLLILALLGGGGVGGGVISSLQTKEIPAAISVDLQSVTRELADLRTTIERLTAEARSDRQGVSTNAKRLEALEERVRTLELAAAKRR